MKLSQELKSLIFKYSNTIITENTDVMEIAREIEAIKNNSRLEGFIFRPHFADSVEFKEYTDEDWYAIVAQWSITFGWSDIFEFATEDNPHLVLGEYFKDTKREKITPVFTEENPPKIARINYSRELVKSFLESKAVLNNHQMEIISLMPVDLLIEAYEKSDITIREIRTNTISKILEKDKTFEPFDTVADIIPVLVEMYSIKDTCNGEQIDKNTLKTVKIRVPKSMRRKVIEKLSKDYLKNIAVDNFKKYQEFWKKVLRQILIENSFEKTVSQYPDFQKVHTLIHSNIKTANTKIEKLRREGLLEEAFEVEMENPGNMLRNILFYLRHPKGTVYPTKNTRKAIMQIPVKTDVNDLLLSKKFTDTLLKANPKLLLQVKSLLNSPKFNKVMEERIVNKKMVRYTSGLNPINPAWRDLVGTLIEEAYLNIKVNENRKLGKVFISEHFKNLKLNYSGRVDCNTVTSGQYLPIGSKIPLELEKHTLIRYGVSWKSKNERPISLCIDPSITILNGEYRKQIVNWQNPTLSDLVNSSGDITLCTEKNWSTELMDIDVGKMRRAGSTKFFTTVINYNAPEGDLSEVSTHIFFNLIDRKNRIIDGRTIEIPLEEMDYSYEINDKTHAQIGLLFDLDKNEVEVLKIPLEAVETSSTAGTLDRIFETLIANKSDSPFIYEGLTNAIAEEQIVNVKTEADTFLDENTDLSTINDILF